MNFSNNAYSVLDGPIGAADTVVQLAAGTGSRFPASDFLVTLIGYDETGNEAAWEILSCSSRTGDTLTVTRGHELTPAAAWPDATRVENRVTAGSLSQFVSKAPEVKTSAFTAAPGGTYLCDTSGGGFTVLLPAGMQPGWKVTFIDYAGTFDTGNLTVDPNGEKMLGLVDVYVLDQKNRGRTFVGADATKGWVIYA